jgi:hypothetical protein
MAPQINIQELYGMQQKKKKNRVACFDHIIELCHRRIRNVASYSGQNTFYEVPGIVIGYPLYSLHECLEYIVMSLRNNGFLVQILPPPHIGVVYISWDPREVSKDPKRAMAALPSSLQNVQSLQNRQIGNSHNSLLIKPPTQRKKKGSSPPSQARLF